MASQTDNSQQPFSIEDVDIDRMSAETEFSVDYILSAFNTHSLKVKSYLRRLQSFNSLNDVRDLMIEGPKDYRYDAAFLRCLELTTRFDDAQELLQLALNSKHASVAFYKALELVKTIAEAWSLYFTLLGGEEEKASTRKIAEFYRKT